MAIRAARWRWSRTAWQRLILVLLWLGHGIWVALGPAPSRHWTKVADTLARPSQGLATRWGQWRAARRDKGRDLVATRAENDRLAAELAQLRTQAAQEAPRLAEADGAVRLLGLKQQIPLPLQSARVIFSTRPATFGGLILDRGRDLGLLPEQGVLVPEGIVGRLWSVGPTQSKVLPADAPNASVAVMLMRSRATGVLQGLGSGRALIRYLSNQEVVQVGEAVLTSGLDRVFPRGLLVGYVAEVTQGDLELRVIVNLSAPLDRVSLVLLLPPQPPLEVQPPLVAAEPRPQQQAGDAMRIPAPSATRQHLLCAAALGLVFLSAPFPRVQLVFHAMLVLALAPRSGAALAGALWSLAAGWALESSLRLYPHLGGTPWADLTLTLLAGWMAGRWPLEGLKGWLVRLAAFSVIHGLLVHGAVRMANGPHPWGWGWLWVLLSVPLWGWLAWRLLHAGSGSGRR